MKHEKINGIKLDNTNKTIIRYNDSRGQIYKMSHMAKKN